MELSKFCFIRFYGKIILTPCLKFCGDLVKTSAHNLYESYRKLVNMIGARNSSKRPLTVRTLEVIYQIRESL